jgi:uncharacterized protein (TIGR03000 family)
MKRSLFVLALCVFTVGMAFGQPRARLLPADHAVLIVRVPSADAVVRIGDFTSNQRGLERHFSSPVLKPGLTYWYQIDVTWTENGKPMSASRDVTFRVGELATVDFRAPSAGDLAKALGKEFENIKGNKISIVPPTKERTFLFTYAGAVKNLQPGQEASIWLPVARSGPEQTATIITQNLPTNGKTYMEKQYGNTSLYFEARANDQGIIPFEVVYKVTRKEVVTSVKANGSLKPSAKENLTRFLQPDVKVPVDGKPLELLKGAKIPMDQFAAARIMYDVVNTHMKYSKEGKGWGQGDSVWACDSKFGNCTDFHSLFISMARGNQIPSKFEMGFPIPPKRGEGAVGGYHCWAWFLPEKRGWIPVDISEANRFPEMKEYYFGNLTEDRVRFTTGRDINLEPRQQGPALNFFIYPYVEVNGKVYPQEKIDRRFAYKDVQ